METGLKNRAVDNLVLLLLGLTLLIGKQNMVMVVPALLLGVITVSLGICISEGRHFAIVAAVFLISCFFLPELKAFLPVLFYYGCLYFVPWGAVWMAAGIFASVFSAFQGKYEGRDILLWTGICLSAVVLVLRTDRLRRIGIELIRMRDADMELNIALQEKNKSLREKQDYEVYLATLRERNRIAREIHDNMGHLLSRSILQVGALGTVYGEEPLHGRLTGINETLNQAMNSIRESVHDLHDDAVDLRQAVYDATQVMRDHYMVRIEHDMSKAVPLQVKYCFIATVKEAMSNVVKHSDGDQINIVLREHPGFYQLFIGDNGTRKPHKISDGIGLSNMKERVEALNGTLHINEEKGFQIMISIRKEE